MSIKVTTLDNGCRIATSRIQDTESVAIGFFAQKRRIKLVPRGRHFRQCAEAGKLAASDAQPLQQRQSFPLSFQPLQRNLNLGTKA